MKKFQTGKRIAFQIGCFTALFFAIVFFYLGVRHIYFQGKEGSNFDLIFGETVWKVFSYLFFLLPFYSFTRLAFRFNAYQVLVCRSKSNSFGGRIKFFLKNPLFWSKFAIVSVAFAALPANFLHLSPYLKWAAIPAMFLLLLSGHVSVLKQWNFDKPSKPERILKKIGSFLLWAAIYLAGGYVLPTVVAAVYSLFQILRLVWNITILTTLLLTILTVTLVKFLRAIFKRKQLIRRLAKICKEKNYKFKAKRVYRSVLFAHSGPNITVQTEQNTYECKLLCVFSRFNPLYLFDNGEATIVHRFRIGKLILFQFLTVTKYTFASSAEKILIVTPISHTVYLTDGKRSHEMDVGDRILEYTMFSASSFANALEREVLK